MQWSKGKVCLDVLLTASNFASTSCLKLVNRCTKHVVYIEIEMVLSTSYLPICACGKLPGLPYILEHCNVVIYVAVPDRNRILVHRVFWAHQRVQRATALRFRLGRGSYALCGHIRYSCIYIVHMSPTLSGSSVLHRVKLGDVLEIRDRIIFDFYPGLPHM